MTFVSTAQPMPASMPQSTPPTAPPQLVANGRPVNGSFDFFPRAAGVGNEQFD
jgi:hypothetical protein